MKKLFIITLLALSLSPRASFAAPDYKLIEPLPCIQGVGNCAAGGTISKININDYILYVYKFSLALAVFLAIVMIIWGGFLYVTSEVPFIKSDGKSKITNAITGLAMVLVSYLILLTIDPRLVNIDSTIPAIVYDKKALQSAQDFQSALAKDLKNMSTENQAKITDLKKETTKLQQDKIDLEASLKRGEIGNEEFVQQSSEIDYKIKKSIVDARVLVATNNGAVSFARALENIADPEGLGSSLDQYTAPTVPNNRIGDGHNPRPTDSPNIIQNQYNREINEILKTNSNFDKVQVLENQRDFYIAQVKEEVELTNHINSKKNVTAYPGYVDTDTAYLNSKLAQYRNEITDPHTPEDTGLSVEAYSKLIQSKIDSINQALGNKI